MTTFFDLCRVHADEHQLVGSSFGGAVLIELLKRGAIPSGSPVLLLAPAHELVCTLAMLDQNLDAIDIKSHSVLICHGSKDTVVPLEHSRRLSAHLGVRLVVAENESHQIDKSSRSQVGTWISELMNS